MTVRMRHTSSHTRNRRSHHALSAQSIVVTENGGLRQPHRLDEATGMYRGKQIVSNEDLARAQARVLRKLVSKREHLHEHAEGSNEPVQVIAQDTKNEKMKVKSAEAESGHATENDRPNPRAGQ